MGAIEEGGKAASGIIDALKSQPSTLAMIVISFALLGYTFYEGSRFHQSREVMMKIFLEQQREVQQLLAKCIVPDKTAAPSSLLRLPIPKVP